MEVNAHSLFSKWFSESGKLVSRLFAKIQASCWAGAASFRSRGRSDSALSGCHCTSVLIAATVFAAAPCLPVRSACVRMRPANCLRLCLLAQEVVDEPDTLVFVLIDEVESLTAAR